MSENELTPNSVMTIEGILYSDYIPPLKTYGPLRKCSVKVSDIVNLLNNDINVLLREDQVEKLYIFVKKYNAYITAVNSSAPKASRCEEVLFERIHGAAMKEIEVEDKQNPFIADDEEELSLAAETIALQSNGTESKDMKNPLKYLKDKKAKIKRPHVYDVFNTKETQPQTFTQQLDETKMLDQFGLIDFDID